MGGKGRDRLGKLENKEDVNGRKEMDLGVGMKTAKEGRKMIKLYDGLFRRTKGSRSELS